MGQGLLLLHLELKVLVYAIERLLWQYAASAQEKVLIPDHLCLMNDRLVIYSLQHNPLEQFVYLPTNKSGIRGGGHFETFDHIQLFCVLISIQTCEYTNISLAGWDSPYDLGEISRNSAVLLDREDVMCINQVQFPLAPANNNFNFFFPI